MRVPGAALALVAAGALGCTQVEPATTIVLRTEPLGTDTFDKLVVEVRRADAAEPCGGCRRELSAQELSVSGQSTFDVAAPSGGAILASWAAHPDILVKWLTGPRQPCRSS